MIDQYYFPALSSKEDCPLGGDKENDCEECAYAGEYHYVDGDCVKRDI